jgi:hypothetical protein
MKSRLKKKPSTEKVLKPDDSINTFLVETSFNSDIDMHIREEIDKKYHKSKINSEYIFPRVEPHKKTKSKQLSTKSSFENLCKFIAGHKSTRSAINPSLATEIRTNEKFPNSKPNFVLIIPNSVKNEPKKEGTKRRGHSYRQLKTERNLVSKSPKSKKKYIGVYTKNTPVGFKKNGNREIASKGFTTIRSRTRILSTAASMRLKKVFCNMKHNAV